jgi:hypothetical protein
MVNIESFESNPALPDQGSCDIIAYDQPLFVGLQIDIKFNDKRKDAKYGLSLQLKYNQRMQVDGVHKVIQLVQHCNYLLIIDKPLVLDTIKYEQAMLLLPLVRDAVDKLEEQALNNNCSKFEITSFSDTSLISVILKSEPHYLNLV